MFGEYSLNDENRLSAVFVIYGSLKNAFFGINAVSGRFAQLQEVG